MPTTTTAGRVRRHAVYTAALTGALAWGLSACGEESTTATATDWQDPSAYTYMLQSSGGDRPLIGTFEVAVRDGKVVKAAGVDGSGRRVVERKRTEVPTIAELLAQAEAAREDRADVVHVEYAKDGRPTSIFIDWKENAIDDEEAYALSDYEALG